MTSVADRTTTTRPLARAALTRGDSHVTARLVAAALLVAVSYIHWADQGGLAFDKSPGYLLAAYLVVEVLAVVAAAALLKHPSVATWLLAAGCGAGPMLGFVLTRSTGLPGATSDIGNWGEPLGVASLVVEGTLLLLAGGEALRVLLTTRRA